jgi:hypothetical protein
MEARSQTQLLEDIVTDCEKREQHARQIPPPPDYIAHTISLLTNTIALQRVVEFRTRDAKTRTEAEAKQGEWGINYRRSPAVKAAAKAHREAYDTLVEYTNTREDLRRGHALQEYGRPITRVECIIPSLANIPQRGYEPRRERTDENYVHPTLLRAPPGGAPADTYERDRDQLRAVAEAQRDRRRDLQPADHAQIQAEEADENIRRKRKREDTELAEHRQQEDYNRNYWVSEGGDVGRHAFNERYPGSNTWDNYNQGERLPDGELKDPNTEDDSDEDAI